MKNKDKVIITERQLIYIASINPDGIKRLAAFLKIPNNESAESVAKLIWNTIK